MEDDRELSRQIVAHLRRSNYVVDTAFDGEQGGYLGDIENYDAVILDLGLPKRDGFAVLQSWRERGRDMPVLILTARNTWRERVAGLRAGADDYLSKPFELEEMAARIEALIRRSSGQATSNVRCGNLTLDLGSTRVTIDDRLVELTPLEFRALAHLIRNQQKVVSKTKLTEHLYDQDFDRDSNVIEVLINHLRHKIGTKRIRTHRGLGYELVPISNAD